MNKVRDKGGPAGLTDWGLWSIVKSCDYLGQSLLVLL